MLKDFTLTLVALILSASLAFAGPTACPQFYLDGVAPEFTNQKLAPKSRELCNEGYAVKHSGITRGPLYAAELLTREGLEAGRGLPRSEAFRPDLRLPASERSELSDFARTGMDRGHVANAADAASATAKDETFLLSNMVPQDRNNNRGIWSEIEGAVRKEAKRRGRLYVVTGPLFQGNQIRALKGRVLVPTGLFKAVLDPNRKEAAAYLVDNAPGEGYRVMSIADLENIAGINIFPTLPSQAKDRVMRLPVPTGNKRGR